MRDYIKKLVFVLLHADLKVESDLDLEREKRDRWYEWRNELLTGLVKGLGWFD